MVKNRKYLLGQYEKSMPSNLTWKEKFEYCKKFDFDYIEMSIDETDAKLARLEWGNEEIIELKRTMEECNVYINSICLSGHRKSPLGSHDEATRNRALDIMQKAIDLASKLGVRNIQLAGYDVYYEEGDETTRHYFLDNLKKSVCMAAQKGIMLGFETMETEFMDTTAKAMKYVKEVDSPYLNVYPDMGNCTNAALKYNTDVFDDYRSGKGHIIACHLKEMLPGKYREVPFGTGQTDFENGIKVMKELGVAMYVGEFWYVGQENWEKDCAFASKYLRTYLDKIYD